LKLVRDDPCRILPLFVPLVDASLPVDPVIQAFGRTLARVLVRNVRARRLAR